MKRALVNNCGLFFTGYNAGVSAALCRHLGPDYFDAHYCSSGSVFGSIFYAANQPDTMEKIWRHHVCDGQLINLANPIRGRKVLDLDYLIGLFQNPTGWLNLDALSASNVEIVCVLTDYHRGYPIFVRINRRNIWNYSRGTCAVPYLYGPVRTEHGLVIDGGLSVACPVQRALEDGYDEVVVVYNKAEDYQRPKTVSALDMFVGRLLPLHLAVLLDTFEERRVAMERELFSDPRVQLIRPRLPLPVRSMIDGNKTRLNATIDLGIADAERYISQLL